ncbi:HlyD family type I secretion periplasmic adaptor subunit [Methylobacterium radiotolerans]|uniref:Membrane fusion protein (MFP) family protein n=1 Tax=Methylobacterium radiotolerans (strain ATCC 27329 / DSM 1819 / JCM 2831 / NBRC 15690 / NCIMB 10815 / 0-1) TaxID=426355 RepID=B1M9N8_METRJ|nr:MULTISPECIES: HlyD family type I secretion periplasmic adaptor subunit [Methylobacterium]ACB28213.1 type I secretion membrane fusion protein, HlyD family [Methylobacterium radiotolerans JCM 2831]MDE3749690.1 HlyD family type I secretion periplasmic adaptor subunit [Methylobacterium radiotolerans]PVY88728.1 HlyD family secretion protein [Methylobacterium organophilum]GEN01184.1 HlyD family type I secretion periplasmic adaptor subunit [Methylobacterium radiotolerans]
MTTGHTPIGPGADPTRETRRSLRRHVAGVAAVIVVATGAAAWTAATELSGAIIATGSLVVESNIKKVQHPTGGVVAELPIQEGARVQAGDLLVRLDATTARATYDGVTKSLWEIAARNARLEAERDGRDSLAIAPELEGAGPEVARIVDGERKLFRFRRDALQGQKAQLRERIGQLNEEIKGLAEQAAAKEQETAIIGREYEGVEDLWKKNLIQLTRLTSLQRDMSRLKGERGVLVANIAQTKGKVSETELQIIQLEQNLRSDVAKELAENRAKAATLTEQRITAFDQLQRIEIRAPQTGYVHELAVHTRGGVISPGEQIMLIVPNADSLVAEVRVAPQDIDRLQTGQAAGLRFPSFDQRTTPELNGRVVRIAADVSEDKRTGSFYYLVRLGVTKEELNRLDGAKLMPGMPVEAFIRTADRTVLSYLTKPLVDQARRAFREK